MQLSMWMILDRLAQFAPEPLIQVGARTLRNARLLSDSQEFSRDTLYLQQNDPGTIMCMNGTDIIAVRSDDIDYVLNVILDVFDHCNEWAGRMDDLIRGACTLRELIDCASQELDADLVIADAAYLIYEHTEFRRGPVNEAWQKALEQRSMGLDIIMRIDSDTNVRAAGMGVYYVDIPEYGGTWPVANVFVDGKHQGWVIADRAGGAFTQGDLDLVDVIKEKVEEWLRANRISEQHEYTGALSRLMEGAQADPAEARRALAVRGWRDGDMLRVFAFRQAFAASRPMFAVERFLGQLGDNVLTVQVHGQTALVVNESLEDTTGLQERMAEILKTAGYIAGSSPSFRDLVDAASCYEAACVAAYSEPSGEAGRIIGFNEVKLSYALRLIEDGAVADVRHDALAALAAYDAVHGTQLLETLAAFVRNRGSYVDTYEELFIHRSTLTYRLERIEALTGLRLDDDATWAHLVLSFLLE